MQLSVSKLAQDKGSEDSKIAADDWETAQRLNLLGPAAYNRVSNGPIYYVNTAFSVLCPIEIEEYRARCILLKCPDITW